MWQSQIIKVTARSGKKRTLTKIKIEVLIIVQKKNVNENLYILFNLEIKQI